MQHMKAVYLANRLCRAVRGSSGLNPQGLYLDLTRGRLRAPAPGRVRRQKHRERQRGTLHAEAWELRRRGQDRLHGKSRRRPRDQDQAPAGQLPQDLPKECRILFVRSAGTVRLRPANPRRPGIRLQHKAMHRLNKSLLFNTHCEPGIQSRSMGIPCTSENVFMSLQNRGSHMT